jgi:hypothetical protein
MALSLEGFFASENGLAGLWNISDFLRAVKGSVYWKGWDECLTWRGLGKVPNPKLRRARKSSILYGMVRISSWPEEGLERFPILTIEGLGKAHYFRRIGKVSYLESVGKVPQPGGAIEKVPNLGRACKSSWPWKVRYLKGLGMVLTLTELGTVPYMGNAVKRFLTWKR